MKDFAELVGQPYTGRQKSMEEIRVTNGKIPRPETYEYGKRLAEWEPATTNLSRDAFLRKVQPSGDHIVVRFVEDQQQGRIVLTDRKQLISGDLREAVVLKTGPGRWISG